MKVNKDFPKKLFLDTKVLVNGNKKKPRDLNLEKHIELGRWIQDMIDNEEIIIPCKSCDECIIKATDDIFKFEDNGSNYQFLDILHNDVFDKNDTISIEIVTKDFGGDRDIEVFNSIFYQYPIIKLTKPSGSSEVGNIDSPEGFTYKITNTCGTSLIATCTIYPISVNLTEVINSNSKI